MGTNNDRLHEDVVEMCYIYKVNNNLNLSCFNGSLHVNEPKHHNAHLDRFLNKPVFPNFALQHYCCDYLMRFPSGTMNRTLLEQLKGSQND